MDMYTLFLMMIAASSQGGGGQPPAPETDPFAKNTVLLINADM